ncbi:PD-(D/E)XK motif protein [Micromonospora sp. NPDC004551]|uniref:PD-(D/E)XK motif protein n=1 Tax=Micromonospora sp. NPDC004551 TaxID=3154284 RepID=UPI0033A69F68
MRFSESDWAPLEAEQHPYGIVKRRLFPRSDHDIFLAVQQPAGMRMLLLTVSATAAEELLRQHPVLPRTKGLSLQLAPTSDGSNELQVVLTAKERREVFNPLITDIAAAAAAQDGPEGAVRAAIERFEHWRRLLQSIGDSGLGAEARRGLFGELIILRDQVLPVAGAVAAVSAWRGPTGSDQDFQLSTCAVEVKTGAGMNPRSIAIASERQLDDTVAGQLLLAHLSVDERQGGPGKSLNDVVEDLLGDLGTGQAGSDFSDLLVCAGYLSEHRHLYDEPRYSILRTDFWHVTGEFPRIVESDLRPGVGSCSYRISLVGLDKYGVTAERVAGIMKGEA